MKISYAITVNDEQKEIENLVGHLLTIKDPKDEIVVLQDIAKNEELCDEKLNIFRYLTYLENNHHFITFDNRPLNNNFAEQKNYLNSLCNGDYIFQIDADEDVSDYLITHLHEILNENKNIDVYQLPRINTVDGITMKHISKWGWFIAKAEIESLITEREFDMLNLQERQEYDLLKTHKFIINEKIKENSKLNLKYYKPIINPWDFQTRLYKNKSTTIKWERPVHEQLTGFNTITKLPEHELFCLFHFKTINKQEKQNEFYGEIVGKI